MAPAPRLAVRGPNDYMPAVPIELWIGLLALSVTAILFGLALSLFRCCRTSPGNCPHSILPTYNNDKSKSRRSCRLCASRGIVIPVSTRFGRKPPVLVRSEKQDLADAWNSPPTSPIPEIRVTFPEEFDESGKRCSGRVVVVHVGEAGYGMEPVEECLPPYQKHAIDGFRSLDLDSIGGLKEKHVSG